MTAKTILLPAAALTALLGLALLPVLAAGTPTPTGSTCEPAPPTVMSAVLATIRQVESGDNYTARAAGSTASGAYQFLDTSWAGYGGYPRAWLAPPAIQDAKATQNVQHILTASHGDVTAVPVVWYLGHLPPPDSPEWDEVPGPGAGNRLTPRQYQSRWMTVYGREVAADPTTSGTTTGPPAVC